MGDCKSTRGIGKLQVNDGRRTRLVRINSAVFSEETVSVEKQGLAVCLVVLKLWASVALSFLLTVSSNVEV